MTYAFFEKNSCDLIKTRGKGMRQYLSLFLSEYENLIMQIPFSEAMYFQHSLVPRKKAH
jgi:hypothetical protein